MALGVTDVIQKEVVEDYLEAELPERSAFALTGAVTFETGDRVQFGGSSVSMPNWVPDDSDDEVSDGTPSTPAGVSSREDVAPVMKRKKVWGVQGNLLAALGLNDMNQATDIVKRQLGFWLPRRLDKTFVRILTALIDPTTGPLTATHVKDITTKTKTVASYGAVVDTMLKQGDTMGDIAMFVMHPFLWADLCKEKQAIESAVLENVVDPETGNVTQRMVTSMTFAGRKVFLADILPVTGSAGSKKYLAIGLKVGALAAKWQRQLDLIEGTDATIPQINLCAQYAYGPLVRGTAYQGVVPKAGPTDADLATPAKWAKSANVLDKQIGIAVLRANSSADVA